MSEWKTYTNNRIITEHPSGFYIIKPKDFRRGRPLFCSLCNSIMRTNFDDEAYSKFECCDSCATFWAYPNKDKWIEGWRPSPEDVMNKYKVANT